jgi:hypothetical protein
VRDPDREQQQAGHCAEETMLEDSPLVSQNKPQEPAREYFSIKELSELIPYDEQTIRNLMSKKVLRLGEHYFKPNGRPIFKWSAIKAWIEGKIA